MNLLAYLIFRDPFLTFFCILQRASLTQSLGSDIDVVVKIDIDDPADRGEALLSLWDKLEVLFKIKVDLLTEDSIRNPYLKSNINRTKKLIYDREGEKVFV